MIHPTLSPLKGRDIGVPRGCGHVFTFTADIYSALAVFFTVLVTLDSIFYSVLSAVITYLYYLEYERNESSWSANISWTFVSFAVVFPLTTSIGEAFKRREEALAHIATMKALISHIFLAHREWNWYENKNGRSKIPPGHADGVRQVFYDFILGVHDYLRTPLIGKAKHTFTWCGARMKVRVVEERRTLLVQLLCHIKDLSLAVEVLKREGLPGNEAARLNQYHWLLHQAFEKLRKIKEYRTPQALRSFVRVAFIFVPCFYGPYYVWVGTSGGGEGTNLPFAIALSVLTTLVMVGLFNVEQALEDPFDCRLGFDNVRLQDELNEILDTLDFLDDTRILPWAFPSFPVQHRTASRHDIRGNDDDRPHQLADNGHRPPRIADSDRSVDRMTTAPAIPTPPSSASFAEVLDHIKRMDTLTAFPAPKGRRIHDQVLRTLREGDTPPSQQQLLGGHSDQLVYTHPPSEPPPASERENAFRHALSGGDLQSQAADNTPAMSGTQRNGQRLLNT